MPSQLPQSGDLIGGKYRIVRRIGVGGMGTVFEAENSLTLKRVALKYLHAPDGPGDGRARMLREAQAAARINHRHVVDIYDAGFDGPAVFLVMELLEGETLQHLMERQSLAVEAFLTLIIPALRGVAAAHRQGVIHRDLKPENIFVTRESDSEQPVCKVLDFGVARLSGDVMLTRSGHAIGTPMFMSLEQLRGARDLDGRADVYGFGVILYIALVGSAPFPADTLPELVYKITTGEPVAPHVLVPAVPRTLSDVVMRAIAKDRDQRTPSIEALIAELAPFASEGASRAQVSGLATQRAVRLQTAEVSVQADLREDPSQQTRPLSEPGLVSPLAVAATPPHEAAPRPEAAPPPSAAASRPLGLLLAAALGGGAAVLAWQATVMRDPGPREEAPERAAVPVAPALPALPALPPVARPDARAQRPSPDASVAESAPPPDAAASSPPFAEPAASARTREAPSASKRARPTRREGASQPAASPARTPGGTSAATGKKQMSLDEFPTEE